MSSRSDNILTIKSLYGIDSETGREFLADAINDLGGLHILSDELLEKLAERHAARNKWEMRAFVARHRAA
jgi:hypothetical protein